MTKLKTSRVQDGMIPTERIVDVRTADGTDEQVIVSDQQVVNDFLLVSEIHSEQDRILVELPREAMSGTWRVWVPRDSMERAQ